MKFSLASSTFPTFFLFSFLARRVVTQCDVIKKRYQKALEKLKGTDCGWIIAGDRFRNKKTWNFLLLSARPSSCQRRYWLWLCSQWNFSLWHGYINTEHSFYGCEWKPLMGDSLFNYKARHTQTLFRRVLQFAFCRRRCCCCRRYPEACFVHCTAQHGTLISNGEIENSIVQFNKFNFRFGEVAKLPRHFLP